MIHQEIDPTRESATPEWGVRRVYHTSGGVLGCPDQETAIRTLNEASSPGERYELVVREPGSRSWTLVPALPPLEQPCLTCSSREAEAQAAYDALTEADIRNTCPDCEGRGLVLTLAGRQLVTFMMDQLGGHR